MNAPGEAGQDIDCTTRTTDFNTAGGHGLAISKSQGASPTRGTQIRAAGTAYHNVEALEACHRDHARNLTTASIILTTYPSGTMDNHSITSLHMLRDEDFLQPPDWLVGSLFSLMALILLLAAALYFANFPSSSAWARRIFTINTRNGYRILRDAEGEEAGVEMHVLPHSTTWSGSVDGMSPRSPDLRNRHARLQTPRSDVGLGIVVPGYHNLAPPELLESRYFGELSPRSRLHHGTDESQTIAASSTAPVQDVWTRTEAQQRSGSASQSSDLIDCLPTHLPHTMGPPPGFLQRLSNAVERLAVKLANSMHYHIRDDVEGGLLLPVKEGDREVRRTGEFA